MRDTLTSQGGEPVSYLDLFLCWLVDLWDSLTGDGPSDDHRQRDPP